MAAITDLKFSELNTTSPGTPFTFDGPNSDILVSVKAITGDTYTAVTDAGVCEFVYKLRELCAATQVTVNTGQLAADQLQSFPPKTTSLYNPDTNSIPVSGLVRVSMAVNPDTIGGVNV